MMKAAEGIEEPEEEQSWLSKYGPLLLAGGLGATAGHLWNNKGLVRRSLGLDKAEPKPQFPHKADYRAKWLHDQIVRRGQEPVISKSMIDTSMGSPAERKSRNYYDQ
jgi:hypothetical protein